VGQAPHDHRHLGNFIGRSFRYRGYVYDEETSLYYLRSRYYNPDWGRFINADSVLGKPGILLNHNVFAYCGNNPENLVDPSGNTGTDAKFQSLSHIVSIPGAFAGAVGVAGGGYIAISTLDGIAEAIDNIAYQINSIFNSTGVNKKRRSEEVNWPNDPHHV